MSYLRNHYKHLVGLGISLLLFGLLTYSLIYTTIFNSWNLYIYDTLNQLHTPSLDLIFYSKSKAHFYALAVFWATVSAQLLLQRDIWRTAHWMGLGILSAGLTEYLNYVIVITRPGVHAHLTTSFPSAHVAIQATLWGVFILLLDLTQWTKRHTRQLIYVLYSIGVSFLSISRLYNGFHWLSDILGAFLLSAINILLFSLSYYSKKIPKLFKPEQLLKISLGSLGIVWTMLHFFL